MVFTRLIKSKQTATERFFLQLSILLVFGLKKLLSMLSINCDREQLRNCNVSTGKKLPHSKFGAIVVVLFVSSNAGEVVLVVGLVVVAVNASDNVETNPERVPMTSSATIAF